MTVQRSRHLLWRNRLAALERLWTAARAGDPTAVHQLRVASRRIREALPLVSDQQRPHRVKRIRRRVRTLTRTLGPIRERDVCLLLLAGLEREHPEDRAAVEIVREAIANERKELHEELGTDLDAGKLEKFVRKLTRAVGHTKKTSGHRHQGRHEDRVDEAQWPRVVASRVVRRAKQLRQAIEQAGALYVPDRLHGVRVTTKKLRYALEVGYEARIGPWQPAIRPLREMQDILGQLQDREVLLDRVRDVHVSHSDTSTSAALDRLTRLLEDETRRYHAEFVSRRDRLLNLCAMVRQQATQAIPIGRPAPTRVALRPAQRALSLSKVRRRSPSDPELAEGAKGARRLSAR